MERLTSEQLTSACNDPWDYCGLDSVCDRDCFKPTPCKIPKMVHKLAEYEDTGCEPSDFEALIEANDAFQSVNARLYEDLSRYRKAEEEGRLVELPCKVGEKWKDNRDDFYIVVGFHRDPWDGWSVLHRAENEEKNGDDLHAFNTAYWIRNFTREEAEATLRTDGEHENTK